jgi:C4-dicarboxylate-specific signal transduction histidine kinase
MMGEMASGIAHELNQPLTVINNYSRACIRMLDSKQPMREQCSEVMEKISKQAERAGSVIKQMRHFVKKELPERKAVKLSDIINMVLELTRMKIERKQIKLKLELDTSIEWVLAQDIQIEQVILNLVKNAVEAMEETAQKDLIIRTRVVSDNKVEICISDSGCGVDKNMIDELFDPFISTKEQGMGLGLSISQGIIEAHDGNIIIEENTRGGASFSFNLPIAESPSLNELTNSKNSKENI